ncbi:uncharacterized protein LTR77_000229 [Saxophila tyrrhenica]|uniref:Uncharacterized protein n=1 Tax=Saxophila tyrrhenica TaxID=1690608 RepID=A0AAV9PQK3_9PEZI|nr:hypothetical protein LTR77_000229 [Saxophila tyrrhenica]
MDRYRKPWRTPAASCADHKSNLGGGIYSPKMNTTMEANDVQAARRGSLEVSPDHDGPPAPWGGDHGVLEPPPAVETNAQRLEDVTTGLPPPSSASTLAAQQWYTSGAAEGVTSIPSSDATAYQATVSPTHAPKLRRWKPALMRAGPLSGIFAMVVALGSIAVSLGVLAASDAAAVSA